MRGARATCDGLVYRVCAGAVLLKRRTRTTRASSRSFATRAPTRTRGRVDERSLSGASPFRASSPRPGLTGQAGRTGRRHQHGRSRGHNPLFALCLRRPAGRRPSLKLGARTGPSSSSTPPCRRRSPGRATIMAPRPFKLYGRGHNRWTTRLRRYCRKWKLNAGRAARSCG